MNISKVGKIIFSLLLILTPCFTSAKSNIKVMIGGGSSLAPTSNFSSVETSTNLANVTRTNERIYWESAAHAFIEIGTINLNFLNFKIGYRTESEKKLGFYSIQNPTTGTIQTVYPGANSAKVKIDDIYIDSTYRWDRPGYMILGINYSNPTYRSVPTSTTETISTSGKMGLNIGGGYLFADEIFAFEIISRYRLWSLKIFDQATGSTKDYGNGFQSEVNLNLKYIF